MFMGEGKDLSQRTHDHKFAAAPRNTRSNFDTVDEEPEGINRLRAG
jgi:hypothetical protein